MAVLSKIAKLVMAGSLALYQTTATVGAVSLTPEQHEFFSSPAYREFSAMVRQYQWKDAVFRMGLGGSEGALIMLSYNILNHEGRPEGFGLEDLGQIGCLPGQENGGFPIHDTFGVCHAVCRHEDEHGLPKPKKPGPDA